MTIREVSTLDPDTPWLEYINRILTPAINQVSEDELIHGGPESEGYAPVCSCVFLPQA